MEEEQHEIKIVFMFLYLKKDQDSYKVINTIDLLKKNNLPVAPICIDEKARENIISKNKEALQKIQEEPILIHSTINNSKSKKCKKNTQIYSLNEIGNFLTTVKKLIQNP